MRGTRDFLPETEIARREIVRKIEDTFMEFGFSPLDTPALETAEVLLKKSESIRDEIYIFHDKGGREIGLRFDHTVPLARVIAENPTIPLPFRRYAIGKVWRYDRPQAGRYREFTQADVDIVGSPDVLADVECVAAGVEALRNVSTPDFRVVVNNRKLVYGWAEKVGLRKVEEFMRSVDKWFKIGEDSVRRELREKGLEEYFDSFVNLVDRDISDIEPFNEKMEEGLRELLLFFEYAESYDVPAVFDIRLVRGLDYYTGNVFETFVRGEEGIGSIASGGRYDELIRLLSGRDIPATGYSIGVDRLFALLEEKGVVKRRKTVTEVFVAHTEEVLPYALDVLKLLRRSGIRSEIDVMNRTLRKQLEYASRMGIPVVVIVGPREMERGTVTVKFMDSGDQVELTLESLLRELRREYKDSA